ncbi:MAG: hypothetical protein GF317_05340 [Candidatus Lokiarchaeota archaeon]|nr:hypothetical protein [Candidatus Lokiarchaeota archaeon]MBD3199231.1 hypothetical protein [Candidatus Lokiarchaeota archaeon]
MSDYIEKFEFKNPPRELEYHEGEPLKLTEEFRFYHNKMKFRKELNKLQYLFNDYLKKTLQAAGIRDSYLKLEYTNKYLMIIFTDPENIKSADKIIKKHESIEIEKNCYVIESTSEYLLLLTKNREALTEGIEMVYEILDQVLHEYFNRNEPDKFIQIRPFSLFGCI